jgi:hypothetical protein
MFHQPSPSPWSLGPHENWANHWGNPSNAVFTTGGFTERVILQGSFQPVDDNYVSAPGTPNFQYQFTSDDFVSVTSSNWSNAISQSQQLQLNNQKKKTVAQVVIEDQLNAQSLYKTELCRSFEETGNCRYGVKCQFAHGKDELRPVLRHPKYKTEICRTFHSTGSCPYGKRCRFIHQSPDEGNFNAVNLIPWSRNASASQSDDSECSDDSDEFKEISEKLAQLNVVEEVTKSESEYPPLSDAKVKAKANRESKLKPEQTTKQGKSSKHSDETEKAKKGSKRRLAFFARLSGDNGAQSS